MLRLLINYCLLGGLTLFLLSGCNPARHLSEDEYLLVKNKINTGGAEVDTDEIASILKQKPNRSLFGILRPYLTVHNFAIARRQNRINRWLVSIGEPPSIIDPVLTEKSRKQIEQYMKNKGFFHATVSDSLYYHKRNPKKVEAHFQITPGKPYRIRQFAYDVHDDDLVQPFLRAGENDDLKPGMNFDSDILDGNRQTVTNSLRDNGYFYFNKQYIHYEADSNLKDHRVDLNIVVKNPTLVEHLESGKDTLVEGKHHQYRINDIYIHTDYNQKNFNPSIQDTLQMGHIFFISQSKPRFRPEVILKHIFLKKGELYRLTNHQLTVQRLGELRTFKFISIRYQDIGGQLLDCEIQLTPSARQSITVETEGTNQQGNLGIAGSIIYNNKNTFKGAERFEFKVTGGLEAQQIATSDEVTTSNTAGDDAVERTVEEFTPFNTIEIGGESSLIIPELFLNRLFSKRINYVQPRTSINAAYNFQNRPDFTRTVASINYGYAWKKGVFHSFQLFPIDISLIQINTEDDFAERLAALNNGLLTASYSDQFIPAIRFNYEYNNQEINKKRKNTWFVRPRADVAGIPWRSIYGLVNAKTDDDGSYRIMNIPFAHYFKTDLDVRRKVNLTQGTRLVYRGFSGVGIPLTNSAALPFEKSFYGGGANAIRAWRARSLGPGSLPDTLRTGIDKIGEVQVEGNIEYRFDIIEILEGAAFMDFGNIWTLEEQEELPGGNFRTDRFLSDLAIGAGLGVRLDFSLFILRIDAASQIKDPAFPKGERWFFQPKNQLNAMRESLGFKKYSLPPTLINLGIGYPF